MLGDCVYKIVNTVNNRVYVGSTDVLGLNIRWGLHKRSAKRYPHRPLCKAMNELGVDKFSIHIIETINDLGSRFEREQYWIDRLDSMYPNGYNAVAACNLYLRRK